MNPDKSKTKRSTFISVICLLLIWGVILSIVTYGSEQNERIASWYGPYNLVYVLIQGIFAIGMWFMKRWGFIGFFILVAINFTVHFAIGQWSPIAVGIFGVICYYIYRDMPKKTISQEHTETSVSNK